jgi:hypothetical protein
MTGFNSKREAAADKFIAAEERKVGERYGYVPKLHPSEWMNAQPAQEPVAHLWECLGRWSAYLVTNGKQADCAPPSWLVDAINKATTPPLPKQEPVGTLNISRYKGHLVNHDFDYFGELPDGTYSVYTTPPKREWVGLTPEETSGFTQHEMTVVKYVSKVLQEKNM